MKKIIVLLLCVLMLSVPGVIAAADTDYVQPEETMPFVATEETDFIGGVLMVTIKKEYSFPNRVWALSAFGNPSHVSSFVDITASENPDVINSYANNENYRQIFEFYLDTSDKQTAIAVAEVIQQSDYVYSVSVNRVHEMVEEPTEPQTEEETTQSRSAMVPADLFVNNYRKITADPLISSQYSIFTTHTNRAWAITKGSPDVVVGVIDSGIDPIPDLADNLVPGYDLSNITYTNYIAGNYIYQEQTVCYDSNANHHGTEVASVIAAKQNSLGISGFAPNVKLKPIKVHNGNEYQEFAMVHAFTLIQSLDDPPPIVVMSLNSPSSFENVDNPNASGVDSYINYDWLAAMENYSGLIVNSAANDNRLGEILSEGPEDLSETPIYPGEFKSQDENFNNIIVVGSVNENNQWAVSNWSAQYVDLMAPGHGIKVAYGVKSYVKDENYNDVLKDVSEEYASRSGSSYSAPMVAAAAALLLSYAPTLTTDQLKEIILDNVTYVPELATRCATSGVLNVYKALSSLMREDSKKLYDYCVSIEVTGEHVFSADPITVSYPSDVVQLTDIYIYPEIKFAPHYLVNVTPQNGTITISFIDTLAPLPVGTVAFELWFSALENTITNKFYMANGAFEIDNENIGLCGHSFLLGDHGRSGNLNDMMMWFNFIIPGEGTSIPLDVNRDMVVNNTDREKAQKFLNGEIVSLFY